MGRIWRGLRLGLKSLMLHKLRSGLTALGLIFGVAASNAAIVGPVRFGTPFSILCGIALMSMVVGTFATAAALRHAVD